MDLGGRLRVIDAGTVSGLRSQALWHGITAAMRPDAGPTLSFCRPGEPYVSIGYHRRLDEVDTEACRAERLPIIRRRIGGGPVLIDADQLFFGLALPVAKAPARIDRLYCELLEPAAAALRGLGLDAHLDGMNDITAAGRKVSGTGAGQIGDGVVVVGNVIFRFGHARMARVLALPNRLMRDECLRLMRSHVSCLEAEGLGHVTGADAAAALREAYAGALGAEPFEGSLTPAERAAIDRWEERLADPAWLRGHDQPIRPGRRVKVRNDVFVIHGEAAGIEVVATVVGNTIERAAVCAGHLNGTAEALEHALVGAEMHAEALKVRLQGFGEDGRHVLAAVQPGLEGRW